MRTFVGKPAEIEREWFVVDAEGQTLGRLASALDSYVVLNAPGSSRSRKASAAAPSKEETRPAHDDADAEEAPLKDEDDPEPGPPEGTDP